MGIMVLAWVCAQVLAGILLRVSYCIAGLHPIIVLYLRRAHFYSGYILLMLAKANIIVGWAMESSTVGLAVSIPIMAMIVGIVAMYIGVTNTSMSREAFVPRL